jgi:hypothetical protein
LASIWTRVLNWVHDFVDLGVTVAGPADVALAVPVDDLRPRARHVQITLAAVHDIRFCEKIFVNWMTELDKCVANPFSRHLISSNDNNGFTESLVTPRSQMNESNN